MAKQRMKINVIFFGITRSLKFTISSIKKQIIEPAAKLGEVALLCHFFQQEKIVNVTSNENGLLDLKEYELLNPDWVQLEEPDECLARWDFQKIANHGDAWADYNNNFTSLRNLVHQLHSLYIVTAESLERDPDIAIFCRPDLLYHDNLSSYIRRAMAYPGRNLVYLPFWQWFGGVNDRFAICKGEEAIKAYGQRILKVEDYCRKTRGPLHSERFLRFSLEQELIPYKPMSIRASRVRLGGVIHREEFTPWRKMGWNQRLKDFFFIS